MARVRKSLPERMGMVQLISAGVLASVCPRPLIEAVLESTGRASHRERLLPASAVVYYVMALAIWREAPVEEVLRVVCEGLCWLSDGRAKPVKASKSGISQARTRLGSEVMEQLCDQVLRPLARPGASGAWYRNRRVMAIDPSYLDVPDEAVNADFFGYPDEVHKEGRLPQARVLGLVECGTHAVVAAEIGALSSCKQTMTAKLLKKSLKPGMILVADASLFGFETWAIACATGAELAWCAKDELELPVESRLSDGSYLSRVCSSQGGDRVVRVVDCSNTSSTQHTPKSLRLLTNALDPNDAPALELAELYQERREMEGVFEGMKKQLQTSRTLLRSKTPDLLKQEFWGLLLSHFAIRQLMAGANWKCVAPDQVLETMAISP